MKRACGDCEFWHLRSDSAGGMGGGVCRRYPPIFQNDALNDGWPMTSLQSWCGEFKPRDADLAAANATIAIFQNRERPRQ